MELWCPFAEKRPLGSQSEPKIGTPRILVIHTMVGFLRGTDSMFKRDGYGGTESTFGIGGSWDSGLDGAIWQWQDLAHSADANFEANGYATSVETSDGGKPSRRWSDKQAEAIVRLGVWWCKTTGNPAKLVTSTRGHGFGYHAQFGAWNKSAHACPGSVRVGQYVREIIPEIAHRLDGKPDQPEPVPVDPTIPPEFMRELSVTAPMMHGPDVRAWQARMKQRGYVVAVDTWYGDQSANACKSFQKAVGMPATGVVDAETWLLTWIWEPDSKEPKK